MLSFEPLSPRWYEDALKEDRVADSELPLMLRVLARSPFNVDSLSKVAYLHAADYIEDLKEAILTSKNDVTIRNDTLYEIIDFLGQRYDDANKAWLDTPRWRFIKRQQKLTDRERAWHSYMDIFRICRELGYLN